MDTNLVTDLQKLVRAFRNEAMLQRWGGNISQQADALEEAALAIERVLIKHSCPPPVLRAGDSRGYGYRCTPYIGLSSPVW